MEQEYYSSKHFTAEQIDQRLLQGTYDDAVEAGYPGTKEEYMAQQAKMVSSSPVSELHVPSKDTIRRSIGVSTSRPTLGLTDIGYYYFDTSLNIPIWWDGYQWVNAIGSQI